ncbi:MAG: triple tyrosine motif-containing protein, partial [Acidobacteriota bacterium]
GNFWMSSNQGLARISRRQLDDFAEGKIKSIISTAFGVEDGMSNAECNGERQPAGWKMPDGKLWFPTMGGVAIVDPAAIPINPLPPPVVIEECRLNRESKECRNQLQIEPGEDNLEIQYTANSFIRPEQIKFKYKLIGADPDWIEAGMRRTAFYSHLKPGHYDFTVLAANSDGIWNATGQSLRIVVKPSFRQTWWFWSLMILGIVGIAVLGYRKRLAMLRWEHELRENFLKRERAAQEHFARQLIASQETERRKITAELHDEIKSHLDLINYAALQGLKQPSINDTVQQEFTEISEHASHASYSVAKMIQGLRPQILEAGLTEALISIVAHANKTSETNFIDAIGQVDEVLPKELETHLYLVVQECVLNIIKHARATEARIEIHQQANELLATIQDNGRGFAPDQIPDSGFGLTSIARRVEILGGAHTIKSAPGQGTAINININIKLPEHPHDL